MSRETPLGARARRPGNGSKRKSEPDKQANRPHEPAARPSSARRGRPRPILGRHRTSASRLERANSRAYSCSSALKPREPKRRSSPGIAFERHPRPNKAGTPAGSRRPGKPQSRQLAAESREANPSALKPSSSPQPGPPEMLEAPAGQPSRAASHPPLKELGKAKRALERHRSEIPTSRPSVEGPRTGRRFT